MRKKFLAVLLSCIALFVCGSESFEFVDRDIGEILYAVSLYKGFPVSADDTVSGRATFRLAGDDFESDFDAFLESNRMFVDKSGERWVVSRIRFDSGDIGLMSLDALDVTAARMFEEVAKRTGVCVTFENLPQNRMSLHSGYCTVDEIVKRIAGLCPGFEARLTESGFFHVSRSEGAQALSLKNGKAEFRQDEDGKWVCDIQNSPVSYASERLFQAAGKEFCFSLSSDARILRASYSAADFDEALSRLCVLGGTDIAKEGDVYFLSTSKVKDKALSAGRKWRTAEVKNVPLQNFIQLSSRRFPSVQTLALDGGRLMHFSTDEEASEFAAFLAASDVAADSRLVKLKYIRTADFMKNIPPFIDKSSVSDSGMGDSFYFTGSEEAYGRLIERLGEFDRPVSRVSYDLLIMQYQDIDGSDWKPSLKAGRVSLGDMNSASASLGSVLDLNMDVVSAFGMKFAASLQTAITQSKAKVYADTTLNGVSGSSISFQNTNTYRYRDNNLDPETGEPVYSGVTKEIVSGLKLEVTGIVTGDGMITSRVSASVSRQGTDLSSTTGNPPPSSEKVVTTEVRAKSGEPVVLSGLVQEEEGEAVSRVPFLSRIPLLGRLFKSVEKSKERTELVIYLVPTADVFEPDCGNVGNEADGDSDYMMRRAYEEFVW